MADSFRGLSRGFYKKRLGSLPAKIKTARDRTGMTEYKTFAPVENMGGMTSENM